MMVSVKSFRFTYCPLMVGMDGELVVVAQLHLINGLLAAGNAVPMRLHGGYRNQRLSELMCLHEILYPLVVWGASHRAGGGINDDCFTSQFSS